MHIWSELIRRVARERRTEGKKIEYTIPYAPKQTNCSEKISIWDDHT